MIKAEIVADSLSPQGNRITTMQVTFPRMILAELNTHRLFSRNSASSRAIPFKKTVKSVINNTFIPMAFQKSHSGMQGTAYLDMNKVYTHEEVEEPLLAFLMAAFKNEDGTWDEDYFEIQEILNEYVLPLLLEGKNRTIRSWWLKARDLVVAAACILHAMKVTKQICNRLLEPFMYHTVLVTGTEWENFFNLRCPMYFQETSWNSGYVKSRKKYLSQVGLPDNPAYYDRWTDVNWLRINKGQSEIHMMALAEAMYDAMNESKPKQLEAGDWHIPFDLTTSERHLNDLWDEEAIKIATARCARVSYTVVGEENPRKLKVGDKYKSFPDTDSTPLTLIESIEHNAGLRDNYCYINGEYVAYEEIFHIEKVSNFEKDIKLHDSLLESGHFSPFEHCARAMNDAEYNSFVKGYLQVSSEGREETGLGWGNPTIPGWCNNFRGFIQYRYLLENQRV